MEKIQNLENEITQWKQEFRIENQRDPGLLDIESNPEILSMRNELKQLIQQTAAPPLLAGCTFFISRKRRYCTRKATVNSKYCSTHGQEIEPTRLPSSVVEVTDPSGRKHNLKRPPKRMLNPFLIRKVPETPNWSLIFSDPTRPCLLDIGCAKGGYIEQLRTQSRQKSSERWNFVGVELYPLLAEAANQAEKERNLDEKDLWYIGTNINVSLEALAIPNLSRVTLMFPDPWSCGKGKDKNKKRRVMNLDFAKRLARVMKPSSDIYFASDWHELALDIRHCLLSTGCFEVPVEGRYVPTLTPKELQVQKQDDQLIDTKKNCEKPVFNSMETWLAVIPFDGVMTERDVVCQTQWRPVYRLILIRNDCVI